MVAPALRLTLKHQPIAEKRRFTKRGKFRVPILAQRSSQHFSNGCGRVLQWKQLLASHLSPANDLIAVETFIVSELTSLQLMVQCDPIEIANFIDVNVNKAVHATCQTLDGAAVKSRRGVVE